MSVVVRLTLLLSLPVLVLVVHFFLPIYYVCYEDRKMGGERVKGNKRRGGRKEKKRKKKGREREGEREGERREREKRRG